MEYKIGDRFILRDPEDNYDGEVYTLIRMNGKVALSRLPNLEYEDPSLRPPTRSGFYTVKKSCSITQGELDSICGGEMGTMIKFEKDCERVRKCQR